MVIHWEDYDRTLPTGKDSQSKLRRRELFGEFDPNGNGILQQHEVVKRLFRLFPRVVGIVDTRPLLNLCFRVARDTVTPIFAVSVAAMDRNQFRVLLICLKCYLKAWEVWYNHNLSLRGDGLIRPADFEVFRELFAEWEIENTDRLLLRMRDDFRRMDSGSLGALPFEKFADFLLRRALPHLSLEDEEAEMEEAKRLLKQTHAHLFVEDTEVPEPAPRQFGGVTRALGLRPGRNAPTKFSAAQLNSSAAFDGNVTRYVRDQGKGWVAQAHSQYSHDYTSPKFEAFKLAASSMPKSPSSPSLKRSVRQSGTLSRYQAPEEAGKATRYNLSRFMLQKSKSDTRIGPSISFEHDRTERSSLAAAGGLIGSPTTRRPA